ncbi:MAG: hypothetical protein WEG36_10990 [Gemmatimonadota bacterium]
MDLPEKLVREFRDAWTEEFGETLSLEDAKGELVRMVEIIWILSQPLPGEVPPKIEEPPTT